MEKEENRIPNFVTNYNVFFNDTAKGEPEKDTEGYVVEDDLGQMLRKAEEGCETEKESRDLKHMLEDYRTLLYPDCKQDQKKLGTTLELLQDRVYGSSSISSDQAPIKKEALLWQNSV